jgi:hypothetical protein
MFMNGDKVRIRITDIKHWNETVYRMVNGKPGTIVETSDRCKGNGGRGELKYVVEFDERIFPPLDDPYRGAFQHFWFAPNELEMVLAVPGERCEHVWNERVNHGKSNDIVNMERTCLMCGKYQVADCMGANSAGKWQDGCKHEWLEEEYRDPNFGVKFGAGRKCKKCGKQQVSDYAAGCIGGPWKDVEAKP